MPEPNLIVSNNLPLSERDYFRVCCQEFTIYLQKFQALSQTRRSMQSNLNVFESAVCPSVEYAFRPGSSLHRILCPPSGQPSSSQHTFYSQDVYRLACLFYIHSTLYAYQDLRLRTHAYIAHLQSQVVWNNLDKSCSVEGLSYVLLWVLLAERDDPMQEKLERTRLVLRLMKVSRKMTSQSWRLLENVLFQWLSPGRPGLVLADQWDLEQISSEAFGQ